MLFKTTKVQAAARIAEAKPSWNPSMTFSNDLSGAESSWRCFSVSFGGLPRAVLVFGDEFGDECERSVRRLFGSHVTRHHMDISRVCKRSAIPHYCILACL